MPRGGAEAQRRPQQGKGAVTSKFRVRMKTAMTESLLCAGPLSPARSSVFSLSLLFLFAFVPLSPSLSLRN